MLVKYALVPTRYPLQRILGRFTLPLAHLRSLVLWVMQLIKTIRHFLQHQRVLAFIPALIVARDELSSKICMTKYDRYNMRCGTCFSRQCGRRSAKCMGRPSIYARFFGVDFKPTVPVIELPAFPSDKNPISRRNLSAITFQLPTR